MWSANIRPIFVRRCCKEVGRKDEGKRDESAYERKQKSRKHFHSPMMVNGFGITFKERHYSHRQSDLAHLNKSHSGNSKGHGSNFSTGHSVNDGVRDLENFGGHKFAAGLTIKQENIAELQAKLSQISDAQITQGTVHSVGDLIRDIKPGDTIMYNSFAALASGNQGFVNSDDYVN